MSPGHVRSYARKSPEERSAAVKLAGEVGAQEAARQLGLSQRTVYAWVERERKRAARETADERAAQVQAMLDGRSLGEVQEQLVGELAAIGADAAAAARAAIA